MKIVLFIIVFFNLNNIAFQKENYLPVSQETELQQSMKRGKEIYKDMCLRCHMPDGKGVENVYPPLAQSDYLLEKREASIRAVKYGLRGKIMVNGKPYRRIMTRPGLDNDEIADVMNYIANSWGNSYKKMVTEAEVATITKKK